MYKWAIQFEYLNQLSNKKSLRTAIFLGLMIFLIGLILLMFQFRSELVQPLILEHETHSIVFVISFAIPIVTLQLPSIKHFPVKDIGASLGVFLWLELYLDHALRMGFVESYSFDLANFLYFLLDLLL